MLGEPAWAIPFRSQIQSALDHAGNVMMIEDVYAFVLTGDMQIWTDEKKSAVIFSELVYYPRVKAIRGVISAGNLNGVCSLIPEVVRWGIKNGCTRAELTGRKGWSRALGDKWMHTVSTCVANCKDVIR